jgi:hypothetical protein
VPCNRVVAVLVRPPASAVLCYDATSRGAGASTATEGGGLNMNIFDRVFFAVWLLDICIFGYGYEANLIRRAVYERWIA